LRLQRGVYSRAGERNIRQLKIVTSGVARVVYPNPRIMLFEK
jgi:hypothetical protein